MIIIVCGLPGSGKTFFAQQLAHELGASHISSDVVRKKLGVRDYSLASKLKVYNEMLNLVESDLSAHEYGIFDATIYKNQFREMVITRAQEIGQGSCFIQIVAREKLIQQRLSRPRKFSDADYTIYLKVKEEYEPLSQEHLEIESTNNNLRQMLSQALDYIATIEKKTNHSAL